MDGMLPHLLIIERNLVSPKNAWTELRLSGPTLIQRDSMPAEDISLGGAQRYSLSLRTYSSKRKEFDDLYVISSNQCSGGAPYRPDIKI